MIQEIRTIVIYSGQHLLQQTEEVKATSKSVSAADKLGKHEFERASSIRFRHFKKLFIFGRASAPDQQPGKKKKKTHCFLKRLFPQIPLYDLNTCHYFSAQLHVVSTPEGHF